MGRISAGMDKKNSSVFADHLADLRELVNAMPQLSMAFGSLTQIRLVIDSSIIVGDLFWLVKKRQMPVARTSLQEVIASGTVIAFAPFELQHEVEKQFQEMTSCQ